MRSKLGDCLNYLWVKKEIGIIVLINVVQKKEGGVLSEQIEQAV
jgi:hypothetical protein